MAQGFADDRGEFGVAYLRFGHGNRSPEQDRRNAAIRPAGVRVVRTGRFAGNVRFAEMKVMRPRPAATFRTHGQPRRRRRSFLIFSRNSCLRAGLSFSSILKRSKTLKLS